MDSGGDYLQAARAAFCETISLKMQQFRRVVPKGANPALTGAYVEELVRGFVQDWISPSLLLHGTFYPHENKNPYFPTETNPKQIDGIVYDPRLGPPVVREGSFLVVHPAFCRGVIEIKTSEPRLQLFESRLTALWQQYFFSSSLTVRSIMGIIIQDPEPDVHSAADWREPNSPLFDAYSLQPYNPIFI